MTGRCGPASGLQPVRVAKRDAPLCVSARGACFWMERSVLQQQRARRLPCSHHSRLHQLPIRQQGKWDWERGWGSRGFAEPQLLGVMCQKERSQSWLLNLKLQLQGWQKGVKRGNKDLFPFVNAASVQQQSLRDGKYWSWKQCFYPVHCVYTETCLLNNKWITLHSFMLRVIWPKKIYHSWLFFTQQDVHWTVILYRKNI